MKGKGLVFTLDYLIGNLVWNGHRLEVVYASKTVEEQCTNVKAAKKFTGGDERTALGILSRINALKQASTLKDIVVQPQLHFHNLDNHHKRKLKGYFAIDITSRKSPRRLIIRPLSKSKEPFNPCNIDEIADLVEVVEVIEVSSHYV